MSFQGKKIDYGGDPLQDFTMMRFLDRFVFRKPKTGSPVKKREAEGSEPITTAQNWREKQRSSAIRRKAYDPWGVKVIKKEKKSKVQH